MRGGASAMVLRGRVDAVGNIVAQTNYVAPIISHAADELVQYIADSAKHIGQLRQTAPIVQNTESDTIYIRGSQSAPDKLSAFTIPSEHAPDRSVPYQPAAKCVKFGPNTQYTYVDNLPDMAVQQQPAAHDAKNMYATQLLSIVDSTDTSTFNVVRGDRADARTNIKQTTVDLVADGTANLDTRGYSRVSSTSAAAPLIHTIDTTPADTTGYINRTAAQTVRPIHSQKYANTDSVNEESTTSRTSSRSFRTGRRMRMSTQMEANSYE